MPFAILGKKGTKSNKGNIYFNDMRKGTEGRKKNITQIYGVMWSKGGRGIGEEISQD